MYLISTVRAFSDDFKFVEAVRCKRLLGGEFVIPFQYAFTRMNYFYYRVIELTHLVERLYGRIRELERHIAELEAKG